MLSRMLVAASVFILLYSLPAFAQPAVKIQPSPITAYDENMSRAYHEYINDLELASKEFLLQTELTLEEERISIEDASHNLLIGNWMSAKAFAQSNGDAQKRGEFMQSASTLYGGYNQAMSQSFGQTNQSLSQLWGTFLQNRQVSLQEILQRSSESYQKLSQTASALTGKTLAPDINRSIVFYTSQAPATKAQIEEAFDKQVNQARAAYRDSINKALVQWKQSVKHDSTVWNPSISDQGKIRRANRDWLISSHDALDDLRSAFKSALRKYRLQIAE